MPDALGTLRVQIADVCTDVLMIRRANRPGVPIGVNFLGRTGIPVRPIIRKPAESIALIETSRPLGRPADLGVQPAATHGVPCGCRRDMVRGLGASPAPPACCGLTWRTQEGSSLPPVPSLKSAGALGGPGRADRSRVSPYTRPRERRRLPTRLPCYSRRETTSMIRRQLNRAPLAPLAP